MSTAPEFELIERSLIDQLVAMGWTDTRGSGEEPAVASVWRAGFRQVLLLDDLAAALRRINRNADGKPWLDERRIAEAVGSLERLGAADGGGSGRDAVAAQGDDGGGRAGVEQQAAADGAAHRVAATGAEHVSRGKPVPGG